MLFLSTAVISPAKFPFLKSLGEILAKFVSYVSRAASSHSDAKTHSAPTL